MQKGTVLFEKFKISLVERWSTFSVFAQQSHPRFQGENFEKNKILYTEIEKLAEKHGCTPVQLALAWVLHQGDEVVPIPGVSHFWFIAKVKLIKLLINMKLLFMLSYTEVDAYVSSGNNLRIKL